MMRPSTTEPLLAPRGGTGWLAGWHRLARSGAYLCALAQEVRYDVTLNHRTSSGSATPVGSKQPTGATLPIRDEDDYERHFDYIHYNPVKHGYVRCPHEWPHSSFQRWVRADVLPWHWACWDDAQQMLEFPEIVDTVGE